MVRRVLELAEIAPPPRGYQPRHHTARVMQSTRRRWCRVCDVVIMPGTKHLCIDSHLSSGYRSNINICPECIQKKYKEMCKE